MTIINTRSDLDALKNGPDYAAALQALLGAASHWINVGTPAAPEWQRQTMLAPIEALGFASIDDLLAECAAAGIVQAVAEPPLAPPPLPPPTAAAYAAAVQGHIDDTARARQYADGVALASYRGDPNPVWDAEAQAFVAWRSAVWTQCYQLLAAVQQEQTPPPTLAAVIAALPTIVWP